VRQQSRVGLTPHARGAANRVSSQPRYERHCNVGVHVRSWRVRHGLSQRAARVKRLLRYVHAGVPWRPWSLCAAGIGSSCPRAILHAGRPGPACLATNAHTRSARQRGRVPRVLSKAIRASAVGSSRATAAGVGGRPPFSRSSAGSGAVQKPPREGDASSKSCR
jgi:hypothetical protein